MQACHLEALNEGLCRHQISKRPSEKQRPERPSGSLGEASHRQRAQGVGQRTEKRCCHLSEDTWQNILTFKTIFLTRHPNIDHITYSFHHSCYLFLYCSIITYLASPSSVSALIVPANKRGNRCLMSTLKTHREYRTHILIWEGR